jgi:hypothetical protein
MNNKQMVKRNKNYTSPKKTLCTNTCYWICLDEEWSVNLLWFIVNPLTRERGRPLERQKDKFNEPWGRKGPKGPMLVNDDDNDEDDDDDD